jgi:hypothetical protein
MPAGQLTQFNMNGWNLGGTFPVDQLARFRALSEIDISNNPNMKGDLKKMFDAFSQLQNLQVHHLSLPALAAETLEANPYHLGSRSIGSSPGERMWRRGEAGVHELSRSRCKPYQQQFPHV